MQNEPTELEKMADNVVRLDQIAKNINRQVKEWIDDKGKRGFDNAVAHRLDSRLPAIIDGALGFTDRFGRMSFPEDSETALIIRDSANKAAKELISKCKLDEVTLNKQQVQRIRRNYRDALEDAVQEQMFNGLVEHAEQIVRMFNAQLKPKGTP